MEEKKWNPSCAVIFIMYSCAQKVFMKVSSIYCQVTSKAVKIMSLDFICLLQPNKRIPGKHSKSVQRLYTFSVKNCSFNEN